MDKNIDQIQNDAEKAAEEKIKQDAISNVNKKMVIVDMEKMAEDEAHKAADAYMTEDKAKSNVFKRFWKHSFLEGFYRQREVDRVKEEIRNSGNMYVGRLGNDKTANNNTMEAISERFISDYDGLIKDGEEKEVLNDTDPKTVEARNGIKSLITLYAQNNIQEEAFTEEKNRIFNNLNDKNTRRSLNSYADNLLEIAKNARIAIEHGAKMDELNLDTNIILGKAKSSLSTEAHYNNVDKAVAWTKSSKIGKFLSPSLVGTGIGLAYSLTVGLGTKLLRTKAAQYGTFGAAVAISSALAGMNESQRLAAERAQHGLERAEGGVIGPDSERRDKMEEFQYAMESSKVLEERLRSLMFEKDKDGNDVPKDIQQADLDQILASLAEIDARHSLNEKKNIDLISYTNIANVEKESKDLGMLTAMAKVELTKKIVAGLVNIPPGKTFKSYLKDKTDVVEMSLLGGQKGIDAQDKSFGKFRTKEVIKKVLKTAVVGLTIGATVQEAVAFFKDDVQGFTEGMFHDDAHAITQTPLENLRGWITGHPSHMGLGNPFESTLDGHNFKLPEGASILQNSDQTYNIFRGDELVADHIPLTFDNVGNIDQESMARLGEEGIVAHTTCTTIEGTEQVKGNAEEYIKNHPGGTTRVSRFGWYDNDTPKPIFDQNELKLNWGGQGGVDANGNYVLDMKHMTSDGSFHKEFSVDAQEKMKAGILKMIFSLTQGTQNNVFEVPIDVNGNAVIDPNSEIGKLFFSTENGQAVFKGRFAEVVESFGDSHGAEHVKSLATLVGEGNDDIDRIVPIPVEIPTTNLGIPLDTEPPMFIPIWSRKPLEPIIYKEGEPPRYSYSEKRKENYTDLRLYRNTDAEAEELIRNISTNPKLKNKYGFIQKRLEILNNYKKLPPAEKKKIEKQAYIYNRRYSPDKPITVDEFVKREKKRLYSQTENIYIENYNVGDKPYNKRFYENSPLIKGLGNCKEVVVVLDDPMGDGILSLPIINSINKYFELNGIKKNIKVISKNFSKLYKSLEDQFPNVKVLSLPESEKYFEKNNKDLFVFNTNGNFDNYQMFNINKEESKDLSRVFSVDWESWKKEESPLDEHNMTKYDPLPSRIARSFEIMLGQKLFEDIKNTEKYLEKSKNFAAESKEIKKKYKIKDKERLIVISVGSSASTKEYSPEKWKGVIDGIFAKNPNSHILVLNDPDKVKRAKYGDMFNEISSSKGYNISHADEDLSYMNTIMSMADIVITPDTGLGHYAGALGTKTIMMYLSDPVLWSAPGVRRVIHPKGYETYKKGIGLDSKLWNKGHYGNDEYYVEDGGIGIGASDIEPEKILWRIDEIEKEGK